MPRRKRAEGDHRAFVNRRSEIQKVDTFLEELDLPLMLLQNWSGLVPGLTQISREQGEVESFWVSTSSITEFMML